MRIAKLFRQKGFDSKRDSKSGAGWNKTDVRVPGLNLHIEAKSHEKIKLGEFWSQTTLGASFYKTPVLMLDLGGHDDLAVMRISDFLDLLKTIADDTQTIMELRNGNGN